MLTPSATIPVSRLFSSYAPGAYDTPACDDHAGNDDEGQVLLSPLCLEIQFILRKQN